MMKITKIIVLNANYSEAYSVGGVVNGKTITSIDRGVNDGVCCYALYVDEKPYMIFDNCSVVATCSLEDDDD